METNARAGKQWRWRRRAAVVHWRAGRLSPTVRGLLWGAFAGFLFVLLNMGMRSLALQVGPLQTQFMRYLLGLLVLLPLVVGGGVRSFAPRRPGGHFVRGSVHTLGLVIWFAALPHLTLADTTAIGFTTPIFIMLGAVLVLREPMRWERWVAAGLGFAGVLIVVAPQLTGQGGWYTLLMLASSPVFAASFLLTKSLTRVERPEVIVVWQAVFISLLSLPLALWAWQPATPAHWLLALLCGLLGSAGQYCLTRSFAATDMSATQSARFLELVWACLFGWIAFGDVPSQSTLAGGVVICAATLWLAGRESRPRRSTAL